MLLDSVLWELDLNILMHQPRLLKQPEVKLNFLKY